MIDLHIHTRLSIGENNVNEMLELIKEANLDVYSITDNEHCLAYNDFDMAKHPSLVTGVIFTTSIDGLLIDIIGYEVNPLIINNFYFEKYSKVNIEKQETQLLDKLIQIMKKNKFEVSEDIQLTLVEKGISKKLVYYDALKNNEDFPFLSYREFYRNGLSNPFSKFFLNEATTYPSLKEVLSVIKNAGGKAFLGHPYEYGVKVDSLIEKLVEEGVEGIEVFHPSCALRQSLKLINICKDNKLLASGGSDYRKARYHIPIGINVHPKLFDSKCFEWLNKYTQKQVDI